MIWKSKDIDDYQKEAAADLRNGKILCGGVGCGKSVIALYYFLKYVAKCDWELGPVGLPIKLYIICPAKKRDNLEWSEECRKFNLYDVVIDSWNNIKKYKDVENAFFIFDEQRLVGNGVWVKSFLKIAKTNKWILLSATPGDVWLDYIPVFVANGFYKNRTEFILKHVIYKNYGRYRTVHHYVGVKELDANRKKVLTNVNYFSKATPHTKKICLPYDKELYRSVTKTRWDIFKDEPLRDVAGLYNVLRRICSSEKKCLALIDIYKNKKRVIVFYNFNYELAMIRKFLDERNILYAEYNGHKHQEVPKANSWVYLVQYFSGAEAWNCKTCDTIIFFSLNYSYKTMEQAAGRINRRNSTYKDLYYYYLVTDSPIDKRIQLALSKKSNFSFKNKGFAQKTYAIIGGE